MIGPGFASVVGARTVKRIAILLLVVAVVALIAGYEVAVWRVCIADNPWWYCVRILGR